jgi:alkylhydroperoxidase family enzyme
MVRIEPIPFDEISPELQERFLAGVAEGRYTTTVPLQVYAYAPAQATALDETYRLTFRTGMLGDRLHELLRLRSAQLNGCAPCASSRKEDSVDEQAVACMVDIGGSAAGSALYDERERRALQFLAAMCTDHFAIDDNTFRSLAEVFSVPEIVELGMTCANLIGVHRFTHVLDILGDREPVLTRPARTAGVLAASGS